MSAEKVPPEVKMITATLTVTKNSGATELDEDWGAIGLSSAPHVNDALHVWHDGDWHLLRITQVIHNAIEWPLPDGDRGILGRREPYLSILADWVTLDISYEALG